MKNYLFILLLLFPLLANAQNDCPDAITVCGNSSYRGLDATGVGIQEISTSNACASQENNSLWLLVHINTGGTLGFTIIPESDNIGVDFDFWIFGPNADCGNLGTAIRCSTTNPIQSSAPNNLTGMNETETDVAEGPGPDGNNFIQWLTVQSNETYYLIVDRPHGASNFSIEWTGTATFFEEPVFLNPDNIPVDISQCEDDNVNDGITVFDLTVHETMFLGNQNNVVLTYHDSNNDMITGESPIETPEAYLNTSSPQTIYMRLTNTITGCFANHTFTITINTIPAGEPEDLILCDVSKTGIAEFDLSQNDDAVKNGNPLSLVTYYNSLADAQHGQNPIGPVYQNEVPYDTETIWARLENTNGCFGDEIKSFTLGVTPLPQFNNPDNLSLKLEQCDADGTDDGATAFNLTVFENIFTGIQDNIVFTYHEQSSDAAIGEPSIDNPSGYNNTAAQQVIYIRMLDTITGCHDVQPIEIAITTIIAGEPQNLYLCDSNETGIREFNLALNDDIIKNGNNDCQVTYYTSQEAAESGAGPVDTFLENEIPYNAQTVWARLGNTNGCFGHDIVSFTINVQLLPVFNNPEGISTMLSQCDADTVDDESTSFDLTTHAEMFIGNQENMLLTYHTSDNDAVTGDNPIDTPWAYHNTSNPQVIYVRMRNTLTGCMATSSFEIEITTITAGIPPNLILCDTGQNGLQQFNLAINTTAIKNGNANTAVTFYLSQEDAENWENPVGPLYQNQAPYTTETIWARLESTTGCFGHDIKSFTISILPLPVIHNPDDITLDLSQCDADGIDDQSVAFDLTVHAEMLIGSQENVMLTYHINSTDAATGTAPIINTQAYKNISSPQTVYLRMTNITTGCAAILPFTLTITTPTAGEPNDIALCDFKENGFQLFNLALNDDAVRNGNPETAVTYYASQQDAENEVNQLLPYYQNTEAYIPQTIWARLDNTNGCYGYDIKTFTITVLPPPAMDYTISIKDFTDEKNAISITMENNGDYEFSLDGELYSNSNIFNNLLPGLYTIYIRSKDGCSTVKDEVLILNYPKYFTPNGDGVNETWTIPYLTLAPNAIVHIFDRYGKLITGYKGTEPGWDGTFNGERLPATDYWFVLTLNGGREIKGHFALVR